MSWAGSREVYKSNYEIAKAREASLEKSLAQQISGAQLTNRERLGLAELESRAKAYHAAHDTFIQRYMEVTEQQSLPVTEARVITPASRRAELAVLSTSKILLISWHARPDAELWRSVPARING